MISKFIIDIKEVTIYVWTNVWQEIFFRYAVIHDTLLWKSIWPERILLDLVRSLWGPPNY